MPSRGAQSFEPFKVFPTCASADSVSRSMCSGMKSLIPAGQGVERLPAGRVVEIAPEHLHPPLQMIRIFGQAVAADPGPRPEDRPGDPLTLERRHPGPDVVDVDPHRLAVEGELIDRRDLQVAEGVLGGLSSPRPPSRSSGLRFRS